MTSTMHNSTATVALGLVLGLALSATGQDQPADIDARIPDAAFFEALDLSREGLEGVREAAQAGDLPAARARLAAYYRSRTEKTWAFGPGNPPTGIPKPKDLRQWGRDMLSHKQFAGEWAEDGGLDWFTAPNTGSKPRMYFWSSLAKAYFLLDRSEELAAQWVGMLRSWISKCPPASGPDYWNGMVAGIRLRDGWPDAFQAFIGSASFTDDDVILFLKSLLEQALFIRDNHWPTGNQLAFAMVGLYNAGVAFPEFREAADWREFALETALEDLDQGYLPDGMGVELSPGYHTFFYNYLRMVDMAKLTGRDDDPRNRQIAEKSERLFEVYARLSGPDRTMPSYQDGGAPDVRERMKAAAERYPDNPVFQWFATDGAQGRRPEYTSVAMPYAGYIALRSGWEPDANCLGFDVGKIGWTHAHQDKLNVVLWAWGRQVLIDPGRAEYSRAPLSMWAMDTFAHNTALVDNRPQRRYWRDPQPSQMPYQPLNDFRFEASAAYDHAAGVYADTYGLPGPSDAYPYFEDSNFKQGWERIADHHRRVGFLKPDVFAIADTLSSVDGAAHSYQLRWQLASTAVSTQADGVSSETQDPDLPNLVVAPLLREGLAVGMGSGQMEPEILGWDCRGQAKPATTLMHTRAGVTERFLTLLLPLRAGQAAPTLAVEWASAQQVTVRLSDGRALRIDVPEDVAQNLSMRWVSE